MVLTDKMLIIAALSKQEISDLVVDFQVWEEKRVWRHSEKKTKLEAMQPMPDDECDEKQKSLLPHLQWPWLAFIIIIIKKYLISREEEEERAAAAASIESMFSFVQRRFWVNDSHEKKNGSIRIFTFWCNVTSRDGQKKMVSKKNKSLKCFSDFFCFLCESEWQAELFFEHLSSWDGQETSKWKFVLRARSKKKFPIKKKQKWQLLVHFHST